MKKRILLVIFIFSIVNAKSQCNQPYKSLTEFDNDTTAFLAHNFIGRAACYKGKVFVEMLTDLSIPLIYTSASYSNSNKLSLSIYPFFEMVQRLKNLEPNMIIITWAEPVNKQKERDLKKADFDWNQDKYNFYKNQVIDSITVMLSENGKYYFKYFKERTSIPFTDFSKTKSTGKNDERIFRTVEH